MRLNPFYVNTKEGGKSTTVEAQRIPTRGQVFDLNVLNGGGTARCCDLRRTFGDGLVLRIVERHVQVAPTLYGHRRGKRASILPIERYALLR